MLALVGAAVSCADGTPSTEPETDPLAFASVHDFVNDFTAVNDDGTVNVVIEIPAGTTAKWEVTRPEGRLEWEIEHGKPRVVRYLGYPGNYGMVPQTVLPEERGGDGDPLDAIVLGESIPRGSVVRTKIIGVLRLLDRGETDDKLISVFEGSPFWSVDDLAELESAYPGVTTIVETWFTNYKGPGRVESLGFEGVEAATEILDTARESFEPGQTLPDPGAPSESAPRSP